MSSSYRLEGEEKRGRHKSMHILTQQIINSKQRCSSSQVQFCSSHQQKIAFFFMGVIKKTPFIRCQTEMGQQIETHPSHSTWRSDTSKQPPQPAIKDCLFRQMDTFTSVKTECNGGYFLLLDVLKCPDFN